MSCDPDGSDLQRSSARQGKLPDGIVVDEDGRPHLLDEYGHARRE